MAQRDECDPELRLDYPLTPAQKRVSDQLCEKIQTQDVLIYAVCGSGKTEIVMDCLRQTLKKGQRAAVAIARRQVVLELAQRFSAPRHQTVEGLIDCFEDYAAFLDTLDTGDSEATLGMKLKRQTLSTLNHLKGVYDALGNT